MSVSVLRRLLTQATPEDLAENVRAVMHEMRDGFTVYPGDITPGRINRSQAALDQLVAQNHALRNMADDLLALHDAAKAYRSADVAVGHFPTRVALDAVLVRLDESEEE